MILLADLGEDNVSLIKNPFKQNVLFVCFNHDLILEKQPNDWYILIKGYFLSNFNKTKILICIYKK